MQNWVLQKLSDEALMKAYSKGHSAAFECLYQRHKDKLFAFVRRQCGNHAIAEELVHDAWLAVIRQSSHYCSSAKFTTWVYRIAYNRLVDYWRKFGPTANIVTEELPKHIATIDSTLADLEFKDVLNILAALPAAQITAMLLKIEGFSREEIADITSSKTETVKSRLRYAKNNLREVMEVQS